MGWRVTVAAVLVAALLHACWNAIAKHEPARAALFAGMGLVSVAVGVGGALLVAPPGRAAWPWLALSAGFHVAYNGGLVVAYRLGDFNQTYPLARGVAPVLVAVVAVGFLHERLTPAAAGGVAVIAVAMALLAITPGMRGALPAVAAASLTGVAIATYTLLDGVGVRRSGSPVGYAMWLMALEGAASWLAIACWHRWFGRPERPPAVRLWTRAAVAGVLSVAAYTIVLWAQTRGALAAVAALRESSVVIGAAIGATLFGEALGRRRLVASALVAAGVVLIALPAH
jgi:drug/metabolite transporter (DMT)-like permease